jgi:hypothetical protein
MFILVACIKRSPKMSQKEFQDYWLKHGKLFMQYARSHYNAVRYVQYHTVETPFNAYMKKTRAYGHEQYDGMGEIWWNSEEEFKKAVSSPVGQDLRKMFSQDEGVFTDFAQSIGFFTQAHVLMDITQTQPQLLPFCTCPITKTLMHDPVIATDGNSYERQAISKWFTTSNLSPCTQQPFLSNALIPNNTLKSIIESLRQSQNVTSIQEQYQLRAKL